MMGAVAGQAGGHQIPEGAVETPQDSAVAGRSSTDPEGGEEKEIEVPWTQGATKRVKLSELVTKARQAEALEHEKAALQSMVQKHSIAAAFVDQLDKMPAEDQAAFRHVLANPSLARRIVQGDGRQNPEPEDETEDEPDARAARPGNGQPSRQEQQLQFLLAEHEKRQRQEASQSLVAQVDQNMQAYPVFGENEAATRFARDSILMTMASKPGLKLDDVVAAHATTTHAMLQAAYEAQMRSQLPALSRGSGGPRVPPFQPAAPEKPFTADDLMAGRVGKRLLGRS